MAAKASKASGKDLVLVFISDWFRFFPKLVENFSMAI